MPKPGKGESQQEFISRCMGDAEARRDFPRQDQRAAFCYSQWRRRDNEASEIPHLAEAQEQAAPFRANGSVVVKLTRRETLHGRNYLVAPVVMVKEMVLVDQFLPRAEIERTANQWQWEGRPITIGHPKFNGQWLSAGHLKAQQIVIGRVQNVTSDSGKLKGEIWIEETLADSTPEGRKVLQMLEAQTPLEVSTGYYAKSYRQGGSHEGKAYTEVQFDVVPDHLAVLPNSTGKCSIADGCGVPRLNDEEEAPMDRDTLVGRIVNAVTGALSSSESEPDPEPPADEPSGDEPEPQAAESVADTSQEQEPQPQAQEDQMDRTALIDLLVNSECCEASREELEATPDGILQLLANQAEASTAEPAPADEPVSDPEPVAQEVEDTVPAFSDDLVATLNELGPDGLRRAVEFAQSNEQTLATERESTIARLIANDRCQLTQEQLQGFDLSALQALERSFGGTYLRPGPRQPSGDATPHYNEQWWSDGIIIHHGPKPEGGE